MDEEGSYSRVVMTPVEFYRETRDHIKHEDDLCNQRMIWLITLQSFLFGAYGFSLGSKASDLLPTARYGFFATGWASSLVIFVALFAAKKSIDRLVDKLYDYSTKDEDEKFPPIIGNHSRSAPRGTGLGPFPIYAIPVIFPLVWSYIAFDFSDKLAESLIAWGLIGAMLVYIYKPSIETRYNEK